MICLLFSSWIINELNIFFQVEFNAQIHKIQRWSGVASDFTEEEKTFSKWSDKYHITD